MIGGFNCFYQDKTLKISEVELIKRIDNYLIIYVKVDSYPFQFNLFVKNVYFRLICLAYFAILVISIVLFVYSVQIRLLVRENKATFTEAKVTSIIDMAHIIV